MDIPPLAAASRILVGKKVKQLRRRQRVPAVIYGHGLTSQAVDVDRRDFQSVWLQAGSSSLVDLAIDQTPPVKVLIQAVQQHPIRNTVEHVDFYRVKMNEKLQADIELDFIGESPAVKEQGGILVRALDRIKVECLPGDLVHRIEVDISRLKRFEDRLHVSDLTAPPGLAILEKPDEVVASVTAPRSESELEALSTKVEEDVSAVSGVEKPVEEQAASLEDKKADAGETGPEQTAPKQK